MMSESLSMNTDGNTACNIIDGGNVILDDDDDELISWSITLGDEGDEEDEEVSKRGNLSVPRDYGSPVPTDETTAIEDSMIGIDSSVGDGPQQQHQQHRLSSINIGSRVASTSSIPRNSSCYFSVASTERGSITDLLSLLDEATLRNTTFHELDHENDGNFDSSVWPASPLNDKEELEHSYKPIAATDSSVADDSKIANSCGVCRVGSETSSADPLLATPLTTRTTTTSLYHDILMDILSYLDLNSLASFSETGRRPNNECYYYLHLQLQQFTEDTSRKDESPNSRTNRSDVFKLNQQLPGMGIVQRLVNLDRQTAIDAVQSYYYDAPMNAISKNNNNHHNMVTARKLAAAGSAAAFAFACMGTMMAAAAHSSAAMESAGEYDDMTGALTSFVKVMGLVGSLAAAKTMASNSGGVNNNNNTTTTSSVAGTNNNDGTSNSNISRSSGDDASHFILWERLMESTFPGSHRHDTTTSTTSSAPDRESNVNGLFALPRQFKYALTLAYSMAAEMRHKHQNGNSSGSVNDRGGMEGHDTNQASSISLLTEDPPFLWSHHPGPYEHIPTSSETNSTTPMGGISVASNEGHGHEPKFDSTKGCDSSCSPSATEASKADDRDSSASTCSPNVNRTRYHFCGWVGAYRQVVHAAHDRIRSIVKQQRLERFNALSEEERNHISSSFMEAVVTNNTNNVRQLIDAMNVDEAFLVGGNDNPNDNNTNVMYPLHAAAFHGADQVLEFLCEDISNSSAGTAPDGGLIANIDQQDPTGWTALHFAVGANSVTAVRLLLARKADPSIEADNGYTPFQWAQRLQHHSVADEFKIFFAKHQQDQMTKLRHIIYRRSGW